jgi:hypothetical protein
MTYVVTVNQLWRRLVLFAVNAGFEALAGVSPRKAMGEKKPSLGWVYAVKIKG